jgi:hypothetical protein
MDQENILNKIKQIRDELSQDQYELLKGKILERQFHQHKSARNPLSRRIIKKLRRKLVNEIELALGPVLDNQREINLRFLEEIERLKQVVLNASQGVADPDNEQTDQASSEEDDV